MLERGESVVEEEFFCIPLGGGEKVGEGTATDEFSDAFEKPLAEGGKTVYIDHWLSSVDSIFLLDFFANAS